MVLGKSLAAGLGSCGSGGGRKQAGGPGGAAGSRAVRAWGWVLAPPDHYRVLHHAGSLSPYIPYISHISTHFSPSPVPTDILDLATIPPGSCAS